MPPLDDHGMFEASRSFTAALLARDDQDVVKVTMGLLAVIHLLTKEDAASRAMVALQLRALASEMETIAPPLLN